MHRLRTKSGTSILSTVFAAGVLGLLIYAFAGVVTERIRAWKSNETVDSFHVFAEGFARELFRQSSEKMDELGSTYCDTSITNNALSQEIIDGFVTTFVDWSRFNGTRVYVLKDVDSAGYVLKGLDFSTLTVIDTLVVWPQTEKPDPEFEAMKTRCQTQSFTPTLVFDADSSGFYFCSKVYREVAGLGTHVGDLSSYSMKNEMFVEARFDAWDLHTNQPVACKDYRDPFVDGEEGTKIREYARGGVLHYSFYWRRVDTEDNFITHSGKYFGPNKTKF